MGDFEPAVKEWRSVTRDGKSDDDEDNVARWNDARWVTALIGALRTTSAATAARQVSEGKGKRS